MCHTAQAVHDWVPRVPEETGICILFPRLPYLKHKLKCSSRVRPEEQQRWKHPAGTRYDTIDRTQTEMRCKQRIPACKRSSLNRLEGLFSIFCFDAIWTNNPSRRFVLLHRKHRDRSWMTRQINPPAISASDAKKLQFVLGLWTWTPTHRLSMAPLPRVVFLRAHWELPSTTSSRRMSNIMLTVNVVIWCMAGSDGFSINTAQMAKMLN